MALTGTDLKIKKLATYLGILQSLTWVIMSLICIILFYSPPPTSLLPSSYMESINLMMYEMLLYTDVELFPDQTFTGNVFNAFMWAHCLMNALWLGYSIALLCKDSPKALTAWSHCTLVVSFWDFLTFVILGADYSKCMNYADKFIGGSNYLAVQILCTNGLLPPFIIAARGFTLWIFNIGIAAFLWMKSREVVKSGGFGV